MGCQLHNAAGVPCCAKELVNSTNDQQQTSFTHSYPSIPSAVNLNAAPLSQSSSSNHVDDVSEMTELAPPPKPKQLLKTSVQAQQYRVNRLELRNHTNKTHKHATAWFAKENKKGRKLGMSAREV